MAVAKLQRRAHAEAVAFPRGDALRGGVGCIVEQNGEACRHSGKRESDSVGVERLRDGGGEAQRVGGGEFDFEKTQRGGVQVFGGRRGEGDGRTGLRADKWVRVLVVVQKHIPRELRGRERALIRVGGGAGEGDGLPHRKQRAGERRADGGHRRAVAHRDEQTGRVGDAARIVFDGERGGVHPVDGIGVRGGQRGGAR